MELTDMKVKINGEKTSAIANAANNGAWVDLRGGVLCGIFLDSGFDGTELKFDVALNAAGDGSSRFSTDAGEYLMVVAASRYVALNPSIFGGVRYIRPVATTAQTGATTVRFMVRDVT